MVSFVNKKMTGASFAKELTAAILLILCNFFFSCHLHVIF